jgi:hypothetical protein
MSHWCLAQYDIFMHLCTVLWSYTLSSTLSSHLLILFSSFLPMLIQDPSNINKNTKT